MKIIKDTTYNHINRSLIFKLFTAISLFLSLTITSKAETEQFSSYEGTHFWVSFMENEFYETDFRGVELRLFISGRKWTNVQIIHPSGYKETYKIPGDSVLTTTISNRYYNDESEIITRNSIEVIADNPIVVYAFNSQPRTSDSYVCIPTANWGNEYAILSMPNDQYDPIDPPPTPKDSLVQYFPRPSEFLIMASENNTIITFSPQTKTAAGKMPGTYYQVALNRGETYLVQSADFPRGFGDLSGTLITSDKPVGVLSGHMRTAIMQVVPKGKDSKDHIVEMLQPISSWGKLYFSIPFGVSPNGDYFKLININPNTKVRYYTSPYPVDINFTDSLEVREIVGLNSPAIWQSDQPFQIAQFMMRTGLDNENKNFDPAMVMLPPQEQFVQRVLISTPGGVFFNPEQYTNHYATIIAQSQALDFLYLDGEKIDTISAIKTQRIVNTDLFWAILPLDIGTHEIIATKGKFSGILFGVGEYDSYAMVLGAGLLDPENDDIMSPVALVDTSCFYLEGQIIDFPQANSSGLNFATVDENLTTNFDYKLFPLQLGDSIIHFNASVIDIYKFARLVIHSWDNKGNKNTYQFIHKPIKIDWTIDIDFGTISWTDSLCANFYVRNNADEPIILNSIDFPIDARIAHYYDFSLPDTLQPNETLLGKVCFDPNMTLNELRSEIQLNFECGITRRITLLAEVVQPGLELTGWDFGDVYVGDSSEHFIQIKNVGNVQIRLDSLYYYMSEKGFEFATAGLFQFWLYQDSILQVPVKFKPTSRANYIENVKFTNHLKLENKLAVTGRGVAPLFQDIYVDFGKRRIGTNLDTIINIVNDGNVSSLLQFEKYLLVDVPDNNSITLENLSAQIDALGIYPVSLEYDPTDTIDYRLATQLKCDWQFHNPIIFDIHGTGTLPVIETKNYDFGDIEIYTQANAKEKLIFSKGNENLFIDSIYVISNTNNAFTVDLSNYYNYSIPIYSSLEFDIIFAPNDLGEHILILGVVNDALPKFARRIDTIIISGNSISPPQIDCEVRILSANEHYVCLADTVKIQFVNNEDFQISLDSIKLSIIPDNVEYEFMEDYQSNLPIPIAANNFYELLIIFHFKLNESANIDAIGVFNEINVKDNSLNIVPKNGKINLTELKDIEIFPTDSTSITLSGEITNNTDEEISFDVEIATRQNIIYAINQTATLAITSGSTVIEKNFTINQTLDKIELKWNDAPYTFKKDDRWSINLSFYALLDSVNKADFNVSLLPIGCFENESTTNVVILKEVCMNPMRPIIIVDDQPQMQIYPNPATNFINIDLQLKKNSYIYISIFDNSGKEFKLFDKKILSKGNFFLIFVVENLTNGKYYLKTEIDNKTEINTINIIR